MKGDCLVIMVALTCTFSGSSAKSQHMLVHTAMAASSWRQQQQHDRSRVFAWLMNLGGLSFVAYDYSASDFTFQKHVHGFVRLKTPFWRDIATLPFCCSSSAAQQHHGGSFRLYLLRFGSRPVAECQLLRKVARRIVSTDKEHPCLMLPLRSRSCLDLPMHVKLQSSMPRRTQRSRKRHFERAVEKTKGLNQ